MAEAEGRGVWPDREEDFFVRPIPLSERSTVGVVGMFIVFPVLAGGALLAFVVVMAVSRGDQLTAGDWFWQVGWAGLIALGLMTALPATGWRELRRRHAER